MVVLEIACAVVVFAVGGMRTDCPGYGNCVTDTQPLYMSNSSTLMPYNVANLIGESPSSTVYDCSTPTEPGGNVVGMFGTVVMTGGMVAKFVGATGTTVVAVPPTSPPHADNAAASATTDTADAKVAMREDRGLDMARQA